MSTHKKMITDEELWQRLSSSASGQSTIKYIRHQFYGDYLDNYDNDTDTNSRVVTLDIYNKVSTSAPDVEKLKKKHFTNYM